MARHSCHGLISSFLLVILVSSAFGFVPSVHVTRIPSHDAPRLIHERHRVHGSTTLFRRPLGARISMEVEINELRLRAAQLGSRLKVQDSVEMLAVASTVMMTTAIFNYGTQGGTHLETRHRWYRHVRGVAVCSCKVPWENTKSGLCVHRHYHYILTWTLYHIKVSRSTACAPVCLIPVASTTRSSTDDRLRSEFQTSDGLP